MTFGPKITIHPVYGFGEEGRWCEIGRRRGGFDSVCLLDLSNDPQVCVVGIRDSRSGCLYSCFSLYYMVDEVPLRELDLRLPLFF